MENKFLHDFMRRQATLITTAIPEEKAASAAPPAGGGKKKKSKYGTASGKHPFGGDDMESRMSNLISEKPPKRDVLAYFKDRIAELVAADDF
jgi:hypothetical protein